MQPYTPTEPSPLSQVTVGMPVLDSTGTQAGTVAAIQTPDTDVRPDLAAGVAEHLMATGYVRIDGTGFLSNDTYAAAEDIVGVTGSDPAVVELRIHRDELARTLS